MLELLKSVKNKKEYILPHILLRPYIAHYTFSGATGITNDKKKLTLLPDASGCIVITFDGADFDCVFWGATTKIATVIDDSHTIPLRLFIEFLPAGAYEIMGISQNELLNQRLALFDIHKKTPKALKTLLETACSLEELIKGLDTYFIKALFQSKNPNYFKVIAPYLKNLPLLSSVSQLAFYTGYSERQLNRIFHNTIGSGVKGYMRIVRFNYALSCMKKQPPQSLTQLSHTWGYYDQAHFIHDFKAISGVTPSVYTQNMSEFYNEDYKFGHIIKP